MSEMTYREALGKLCSAMLMLSRDVKLYAQAVHTLAGVMRQYRETMEQAERILRADVEERLWVTTWIPRWLCGPIARHMPMGLVTKIALSDGPESESCDAKEDDPWT